MAEAEEFKGEIRRTFDMVKPISTEAAAIFYPTLWEINPETKVIVLKFDKLCRSSFRVRMRKSCRRSQPQAKYQEEQLPFAWLLL